MWKDLNKGYAQFDLRRSETHRTSGNLNNYLGSSFDTNTINPSEHRWAVIEAGINQQNEMRNHSNDFSEFVLVTMIGHSHLEGLGNLETVAKEKAKLFKCEKRPVCVFFHSDCLEFKELRNG